MIGKPGDGEATLHPRSMPISGQTDVGFAESGSDPEP